MWNCILKGQLLIEKFMKNMRKMFFLYFGYFQCFVLSKYRINHTRHINFYHLDL